MSAPAGRFVLTPRAELDLGEIWDYIAQDSLEQADQLLNELEKAMRTLAGNPNMGFLRED